jgi:subtilisin family serine protease
MDKRTLVAQGSAGWNLGRISNRARGSTNYIFDDSAGLNTCIYVVDTGISVGHPDFQGRASFLANFAGDGLNDDGNGHGTHCAGIAGSRTFGVAKRTKLFAVKVLDSSGAVCTSHHSFTLGPVLTHTPQGTNSGVLAGINFVGTDSKTRTGCSAGSIATMSLGGPKSTSVNAAVANVVANGVFVTVAAGNEAQDAGDTSPSSEVTAYSVGATDSNDNFASFSNFGATVEIMAPGVGITSTWLNNQAVSLSSLFPDFSTHWTHAHTNDRQLSPEPPWRHRTSPALLLTSSALRPATRLRRSPRASRHSHQRG